MRKNEMAKHKRMLSMLKRASTGQAEDVRNHREAIRTYHDEARSTYLRSRTSLGCPLVGSSQIIDIHRRKRSSQRRSRVAPDLKP